MNPDYTHTLPQKYQSLLKDFSREPVTIDTDTADLLVYRYHGGKSRAPGLLVTAGFDGDEYDGIYAALTLPKLIEKLKPEVSITVLPIVNPWGFEQGDSYIPADHSFPKLYFPGSPTGNRAQRLVWALKQKNMFQVGDWLDLHGGNRFEALEPFVTAYVTGNTPVDARARALLSGIENDELIWQTNHRWPKIMALADEGIAYVLSEAGELGTSQEKAVAVHLKRFQAILRLSSKQGRTKIDVLPLSVLDSYEVSRFARWKPNSPAGSFWHKGEILGYCYPLGLPIALPVRVKNTGRVLWIRQLSGLNVLEPVAQMSYRI